VNTAYHPSASALTVGPWIVPPHLFSALPPGVAHGVANTTSHNQQAFSAWLAAVAARYGAASADTRPGLAVTGTVAASIGLHVVEALPACAPYLAVGGPAAFDGICASLWPAWQASKAERPITCLVKPERLTLGATRRSGGDVAIAVGDVLAALADGGFWYAPDLPGVTEARHTLGAEAHGLNDRAVAEVLARADALACIIVGTARDQRRAVALGRVQ
jgi:hypothetical protein